jgi:threonylcarbamoyladenosine tRNA methylthiotransferase MtaB
MKSKYDNMKIENFEGRTRAFVKIQDGCNNYCSYCIIPFTRGRNRSKKFKDVISEITDLVKNGYKEVVLTGIETVSYGEDIDTNFSDLIENILSIDGLERLRISSIEISKLDDKFFELLKNDIMCNHMHLSLQSGCDEILSSMNRKYSTLEFKETVMKLRSIRKDISLTTDVIVGFPGETDEYFQDTLEFVKEIGFSKIHVFPYSKREGTRAAMMKDQIDPQVKKERSKKLIEVSNKLQINYEKQFIGKEMDVLIEKLDSDFSYGHTSNFLYLKINKKSEHNNIYKVKITKDMFTLSNIDL